MKLFAVSFFLCFLLHFSLFSQSESTSLPQAYRGITLKTSMEEVKAALLKDSLFGYRGDRDVSLLPMSRTLIETSGYSFIRRTYLQFHEDQLYSMIFQLNTDKLDYFSLYSNLVKKYGEPTFLDPSKAVWEDSQVTMSLERPLTMKYIDVEIFTSLAADSNASEAASDILRGQFINEF